MIKFYMYIALRICTLQTVTTFNIPDVPYVDVTKGLFPGVDDVISSYFKNIYAGRHNHVFGKHDTTPLAAKTTTTTKPVLTIAFKNRSQITEKELKRKKDMQEINDVLDYKINIPTFDEEEDEVSIQNRRLLSIKPEAGYRRFEGGVNNLKVVNLMKQFIYETKYQLPYSQKLRKKYKNNFKYKIGYLFSLLRGLKQQQMIVYSLIQIHISDMPNILTHLKLYEKIMHLNVDVMNVVKFIEQIHMKRKAEKKRKKKKKSKKKKKKKKSQ